MISDNIKNILERIEKAKNKVGRKDTVKLVAVTKTVPADKVREAISAGIVDIGENKVQEAVKKFSELFVEGNITSEKVNIKRHLIGHLQTNKVKKAVENFDVIQSVDTVYLLEEINKRAVEIKKIQECMVEVKISEEETKYGLQPDKLKDIFEKAKELKSVNIVGLMAIAPYFDNPELTRPYFKKAFSHYSLLSTSHFLPFLSMGMTNDFEVAIEEGSNMVRVGTGIFGERL
ncbi:MAG: YggS family pyridoxal phosphate-dependent enzyme [Elusimicrobia bacterium]|nr:YggS family pyridoxal phosphate-dependent enzyme [Elusimicrobiota bacterium]